MIRPSNQSGFAVFESILIVIIIGIIGFTGWYAWHSKHAAEQSLTQAASASIKPAIKKTQPSAKINSSSDETASWLLYQPPGKEYSVRLADGWKLNHCNGTAFLYTYNHNDIALRAGTMAVVTNITCGSDGGGDGLGLGFYTKASDIAPAFPQTSSFKTNTGDTVKVYSHVEDSSAGGLGALDKGGTYYQYIISPSTSKTVSISYGANPGQNDDHATVEKVVKTIVVN